MHVAMILKNRHMPHTNVVYKNTHKVYLSDHKPSYILGVLVSFVDELLCKYFFRAG